MIGSGATAVTLIPAMATDAEHVTMLQRSPSYLTVLPESDPAADRLRQLLPPKVAHTLLRMQYVTLTQAFYQLARRRPERVKKILRGLAVRALRDESYVDEHFTPTYEPWDQRLCVVPDGDFFRAIRDGRASVATDHIDRITPDGHPAALRRGARGRHHRLGDRAVAAAAGRHGDRASTARRVDIGDTVAYRGMMLSGVPNLAFCIGYVNASWTLRADLVNRYVPRLLAHMRRNGYAIATPFAESAGDRPLLDLTSGYVQRSKHLFPKQGERDPWRLRQNFFTDSLRMNRADLEKDMAFTPKSALKNKELTA